MIINIIIVIYNNKYIIMIKNIIIKLNDIGIIFVQKCEERDKLKK